MVETRRIAVTGGSGFIGSNVVDALVAAGHTVDVLDVRQPRRTDVGFVKLDITDVDGLTDAFEGVDVVFHLAAVSNINEAFAHPLDAVTVNVTGTANVWEAARRSEVGRAVLASTVWVYSGASGPGPFGEDTPLDPAGMGHIYTSSKVAAEMVVHNYAELYGQAFTILRYGIPYGPRMREELVIPQFIRRALAGEPITVNGDGSQFRNYVYVADLCDAHVRALEPVAENQVFNLEGSEPVSVLRLAEAVRDVIGDHVVIEHVPARVGDYVGKEVSAAKARDLLGWTVSTPFERGIRETIETYLEDHGQPPPAGR
ncbi:MAG: dTDP-glucose 4,6-dehydratase [Actinomycetia bacterium]|nr:dTDP-glucose 4,6-dehydratase [Actinomycetes bacterium]